MMKELVANFTEQLQEALQIGQNFHFTAQAGNIKNVVLTGLGGSGIGGSIIQNFVFDKLNVPFIVNKDYSLPAFVGRDSIVIVSSYSGNTEETVASMHQAIDAGATVVCITSGGQVAEIAKEKGIDCILVPPGMPPRACLGYSLVQDLFILAHFGLIPNDFTDSIKAAIKLLQKETKDIRKQAKAVAKKLKGKTPVIYAAASYEGLAVRFRQQINENGKSLAWHHVIPEMNHNELVGWRTKTKQFPVVLLRDESDFERVQFRMDVNKKVLERYTPTILELFAKGKSYWEKLFYLVHLTDWVSVILAELNGYDAMEIDVINELKDSLSKHK